MYVLNYETRGLHSRAALLTALLLHVLTVPDSQTGLAECGKDGLFLSALWACV